MLELLINRGDGHKNFIEPIKGIPTAEAIKSIWAGESRIGSAIDVGTGIITVAHVVREQTKLFVNSPYWFHGGHSLSGLLSYIDSDLDLAVLRYPKGYKTSYSFRTYAFTFRVKREITLIVMEFSRPYTRKIRNCVTPAR